MHYFNEPARFSKYFHGVVPPFSELSRFTNLTFDSRKLCLLVVGLRRIDFWKTDFYVDMTDVGRGSLVRLVYILTRDLVSLPVDS